MRSIKIFNIIFAGLEIFHEVKMMLYKVLLCIPIVVKISLIFFIVYFIYAIIGVEMFTTLPPTKFNKNSPYGPQQCDKSS